MKCEEIHDRMPDVAAGMEKATPEFEAHMKSCVECAAKLAAMRQVMTLLDEWKTPEPSPYFNVRLQARLREEMSRQPAGWLAWMRKPALAMALTVMVAGGAGLLYQNGRNGAANNELSDVVEPGSAVGDLQALEKNHEIYNDFDLLEDLQVQQDVVANP